MPEALSGAGAAAAALPAALSFDRVAGDYDRSRSLPPFVARTVAEMVCRDIAPSDWLLDAGVGTGRYGRELAARHARTIGVDVSRAMMARLRGGANGNDAANVSLPHLARADLRALPFPGGAFAAVFSAHVFHLIAAWEQALDEAWRVLRTDGGTLWVAREDEDDLPVRSFYLRRAAARGVLPPNPGARTQQILDALAQRGARINEVNEVNEVNDVSSFGATARCWTRVWSARDVLGLLARRAYSLQWTIPETDHRALLGETETWARNVYKTLDAPTARVETRLRLFSARKP